MIKKLSCLVIGILTMLVSTAFAANPPAKTSEPSEAIVPLNKIVAVVNDEIITQSDLDEAIEQLKQQITYAHAPMPSQEQLREDALQQLINYRLQLQMASRNNFKPTDEELNNAIQSIAKSHNMTVDQMKEQLRLQNSSYEDFRKKIMEQLIISKLQQMMVGGKVRVTDQDIQEYKNTMPQNKEYQLADFFLALPEKPTPQQLKSTLAAAEEIQQKLDQGADIRSILPEYNDLGWRSPEDLPQLFADQLPNLTLQNASKPLLAPNGYHVLKLLGVRDKNKLSDEQIRNLIFQEKYQAAVKVEIEKARRQAYVQIMPQ